MLESQPCQKVKNQREPRARPLSLALVSFDETGAAVQVLYGGDAIGTKPGSRRPGDLYDRCGGRGPAGEAGCSPCQPGRAAGPGSPGGAGSTGEAGESLPV